MRAAYSETFKAQMVQKLTSPGGPSAAALSRETGVCQTTLSRWIRQSSRVTAMSTKNRGKKRPQDWSAEEKLAIVLEAAQLDEGEALGRLLRERGLHRATLERWRTQMLQGLAPAARTSRKQSPEARRVRELERELRRKEKALAEASALLVLKKKAALIWGEEDDDTPGRSGK
jgi:transposase-like protein